MMLHSIGLLIVCHPKLDKYLSMVVDNFDYKDKIILYADYKITPEEKIKNIGLQRLDYCDYVWTIDADEVILPDDQKEIIKVMSSGAYDAGLCSVIDYTSDLEHKFEPREHKPVVIVNPKTVKFYDGRCCHYSKPKVFSYAVHHFGFTFSPEILQWKKNNYWNKKNSDEFEQLLNRPIEKAELPTELLCLTR